MNEQQRDVIEQALDAFECICSPLHVRELTKVGAAMFALRQLLEQPEPVQEPQAFLHWYDNAHWGNEDFKEGCHRSWNAAIKYTTPPAQPADHGDELTIAYLDGVHTGKKIAKREWVGLTEEEILAELPVTTSRPATSFARAVEAKLREKNGGA
jgi:hypothetical protein